MDLPMTAASGETTFAFETFSDAASTLENATAARSHRERTSRASLLRALVHQAGEQPDELSALGVGQRGEQPLLNAIHHSIQPA